ncbi:MAG: hypothetical protein J3T61_12870 [Candidatus Brocadiales bacterium]|nr:hypothetical protein [Candidatus Bathyanammoxibius sp.]
MSDKGLEVVQIMASNKDADEDSEDHEFIVRGKGSMLARIGLAEVWVAQVKSAYLNEDL